MHSYHAHHQLDAFVVTGLIQLNESNVWINETLVAPSLGQRHFPRFPPRTLAVPHDLFDHLKDTRKFPFGWFAGQFLKYAMRPNPRLEQYIQERRRELVLHPPHVGSVTIVRMYSIKCGLWLHLLYCGLSPAINGGLSVCVYTVHIHYYVWGLE